MDMQQALRQRLRDDAVVAGIVGNSVTWGGRPSLPAVTLKVVGGDLAQTMKGLQSLQFVRVQVDCWAKADDQAQALVQAVIDACGPRQRVNGIYFRRASATHPRDLGEQTSAGYIHRKQTDLTIRFSPA
jgi:hypothetical protein